MKYYCFYWNRCTGMMRDTNLIKSTKDGHKNVDLFESALGKKLWGGQERVLFPTVSLDSNLEQSAPPISVYIHPPTMCGSSDLSRKISRNAHSQVLSHLHWIRNSGVVGRREGDAWQKFELTSSPSDSDLTRVGSFTNYWWMGPTSKDTVFNCSWM